MHGYKRTTILWQSVDNCDSVGAMDYTALFLMVLLPCVRGARISFLVLLGKLVCFIYCAKTTTATLSAPATTNTDHQTETRTNEAFKQISED